MKEAERSKRKKQLQRKEEGVKQRKTEQPGSEKIWRQSQHENQHRGEDSEKQGKSKNPNPWRPQTNA